MRKTTHKTMSVIGAGRVGSTLALMLYRAGYHVVSVMSKKKTSAGELARLVECPNYSDSLSDIHPAAHMILVAVPEEYISEIAGEISKRANLDFPNVAVFHTSGSLTSDALLPLRRKGATTFSLHPLQSFSKSSSLARQIAQMWNVVYGFEGDKTALPVARQVVKALGGKLVQIPKEEKILYHIAGVIASNYSVALLGAVDDIIKRMDGGIELAHFKPIVRTSIENAFQQSPAQALTGPIARGSFTTVERHVHELQKTNRLLAGIYRQVGLQALKMAIERKSIQPKIAKHLRQILES